MCNVTIFITSYMSVQTVNVKHRLKRLTELEVCSFLL